MLGRRLADPEGLEGSGCTEVAGLGLLPLHTRFAGDKTLRRQSSRSLWPAGEGLPLEGFELHHGRSACDASPLCEAEGLGWWQAWGEKGGLVAGSYLHGVFENGAWRRRWLNGLRNRRGLPALSEAQPHHHRQRQALLDRLAEAFEHHVDLAPLLK
jgi:adenosylcobyric acid synthase